MTGPLHISRSRGDRPMYVQLADQIAGDIEAGQLAPGDRVASEPELMRRHNISRATAVKALEHLEQQGLVRRERGRGTFVEAPRLVQRNAQLGSFSDQVRSHGHAPSQRLLAIGPAREPHAQLGDELTEIRRLRLVDGEPVGVHATVLRASVALQAGLDEAAFAATDASLYALLDAAGIRVAEAVEHLQAVAATAEEAELLGVAPQSPLMRVVRVSYDAQGEPLEVVDARYRADRFDYSVSLVRHGGKEQHAESFSEGSGDDRARGRGGGRVRQVGRRGVR
jgi:GntR family transcriptional regulator